MENQTPNSTPVAIPQVEAKQPKFNNFLVILLSVLLFLSVLIAGFFAYQTQRLVAELRMKNEELRNVAVATTEPTIEPVATSDPTADLSRAQTKDWKTYISPEIGDYVSPFQLSYPSTWVVDQKLISEEPKSLTLALTNSKNETIKISQGMGGGGSCIFYDDSDYTTYEGMGRFFSSYNQLNKPAFWRVSTSKDVNEKTKIVCEKTKDRYIDTTRIGWISIDLKSDETMSEAKLILEKIVFKPTATTKTLFS